MLFKSLLILAGCFIGLAVAQNETTYEPTTFQPNATNTTTAAPTTLTTTASDKPQVMNFTAPKNSSNPCLLLQFAIDMNIMYTAMKDKKKTNETLKVAIPTDYDDFDGTCGTGFTTFKLMFWTNWSLSLNYSLSGKDNYELSSVMLTYNVDSKWFPNADPESSGLKIANSSMLSDFSASTGSSYKCSAKTTINLGTGVSLDVTNYQGEPFYKKGTTNDYKFHTAVDCPADQTGTSKLVPIIVGSALAFLVILVLIAYLIGRRKHRAGYQTV